MPTTARIMAASQAQSEVGLKERFYREFQHQVTLLQEQIESLNNSLAGSERNEAIDHCLAGIDRLSHEVKDASSYIPAYDQRSYSQAIKMLSEKLQNTRNTFNPPKKFSFKSRKHAPAAPASNATQLTESGSASVPDQSNVNALDGLPPSNEPVSGEEKQQQEGSGHIEDDLADGIQDGPGLRRPSFSTATKITIANHTNLHLRLPTTASHATSSGTILNMRHCIIDLSAPTGSAPFSALYLRDIDNSLIICGQVAGAIHITNVVNSVLVTSCRQFRMHASKNVDVYLHSASRPIIEDCEWVRFAPMPEMMASPQTLQSANHWNQIDDFKWLKVEASPNFSLLAESERITDEVWRSKVAEVEELDDVLKAVGL